MKSIQREKYQVPETENQINTQQRKGKRQVWSGIRIHQVRLDEAAVERLLGG